MHKVIYNPKLFVEGPSDQKPQSNESIATFNINISKDATNGEALCLLFPTMHYTLLPNNSRVVTTIGIASTFDKDWWNAPYKPESEVSQNADSN